jgi:phosphoglycolate phosphatase
VASAVRDDGLVDPFVPAAVIFDLDGVLVDSYAAVTQSINRALAGAGLPSRPQAELRQLIGPPTFSAFSMLLGEPQDSPAVLDLVARYRAHYAEVYLTQTTVIDGVPAMLAALAQQFPLAIATSKSVLFTQPLLDALDLSTYFRFVAAAASDDAADDKTAIVGRALTALDRLPAAMVGDRSFDIAAARTHGLLAIGVTWGIGSAEELNAAGADTLLDEPHELIELLLAPRVS